MTAPLFEHRYSVRRAAKSRVIVGFIMSAVFIAAGLYIAYGTSDDGSIFPRILGWLFVLGGVINLAADLRFSRRSRGQEGEWHIHLDPTSLTWSVPDHAHGPETDFTTKLEEISLAEYRYVDQIDEDHARREYWITLRGQDAFRLQEYSNVDLNKLFKALRDTGVNCRELTIRRNRDGKERSRKEHEYKGW